MRLWKRLSERVPFLNANLVRPADTTLPDICILIDNFPPPLPQGPLGQVLVWYRDDHLCVIRDYLLLESGSALPGNERQASQLGFKSGWANRLLDAMGERDSIGEELSIWGVLREQAEVQLASTVEATEEMGPGESRAFLDYLRAYANELSDWIRWLGSPHHAQLAPEQFPIWLEIR